MTSAEIQTHGGVFTERVVFDLLGGSGRTSQKKRRLSRGGKEASFSRLRVCIYARELESTWLRIP